MKDIVMRCSVFIGAQYKKLILVFMGLGLSVLLPLLCHADEVDGKLKPTEFPVHEVVKSYTYYSEIMKGTYEIIVKVPYEYTSFPDRIYPALVVTDGLFTIADMALMQNRHRLEKQMILVSIRSPKGKGRRLFEFSPPDWDMKDRFGQIYLKRCAVKKPSECSGGAPLLLDFIADELLVELSNHYRIDHDNLTLGGHSAGGFFTAWTMFQQNSPFKHYIISSPALNYGNGEIFRLEDAYALSHKDFDIGIYMSSGALEMSDPYLEGVAEIVSGQARLSALLSRRNYPSLRLDSEIHQGKDHDDVILSSFIHGVRRLFGTKPVGTYCEQYKLCGQ